MRTVFLISVFVVLTKTSTQLRNVTINKCCRMDEYLGKDTNFTCVPNKPENEWKLKVFLIANKTIITTTIPKHWQLKEGRLPKCSNPVRLSKYSLHQYIFFFNGSLAVLENGGFFQPTDYCLEYEAVVYCSKELEALEQPAVGVKKCCGKNGVYSHASQSCKFTNESKSIFDIGSDKRWLNGFPECSEHIVTGNMDNAALMSNGSLYLNHSKILLAPNTFCLEDIEEDRAANKSGPISIFTCSDLAPPITQTLRPGHENDVRFILYPIGLALSAVFLAATLAAGFLLPASHHVLHWRCQTNHVACLLVGTVLLCMAQLAGSSIRGPMCFFIAVSMHFWLLSAFFWLNTMCFNIWWTFRDLRPQSIEKSQERFRLRLYEIYAWGGPLIMAGTAAILDQVGSASELRPKFCKSQPWFGGDIEQLTYFTGPVGLLLFVNVLLFAATARELTCGLWKRELVKSTSERAALGRICMKLVVVMGITWIMDVVSTIVGGPQEIWYLPDLINCLQGVFIFIVIGCQPQVLAAAKKFWCWHRHGTSRTAGTTNHHSSSSQGMPSMGDTVTNHSVTNNTTKSVPLETTC